MTIWDCDCQAVGTYAGDPLVEALTVGGDGDGDEAGAELDDEFVGWLSGSIALVRWWVCEWWVSF